LVSAQTPPPIDQFQIRYQSNLQVGDGIVIVTPTPTASPVSKATVAPAVSAPTQALTTTAPTRGGIVAPTDTGTNTFGKNIPIEGSQVNKPPTSTGTGTFTPRKNITIENSQFQNNAAVGNTKGASPQTTTTSRVNSKRNVTDVGQSGGERSKKQKQQHQRQSDHPPE
jgi:hypothetical protein